MLQTTTTFINERMAGVNPQSSKKIITAKLCVWLSANTINYHSKLPLGNQRKIFFSKNQNNNDNIDRPTNWESQSSKSELTFTRICFHIFHIPKKKHTDIVHHKTTKQKRNSNIYFGKTTKQRFDGYWNSIDIQREKTTKIATTNKQNIK